MVMMMMMIMITMMNISVIMCRAGRLGTGSTWGAVITVKADAATS
jgi:hypothetical protein